MNFGNSAITPRRLLIIGDPALSRGLMKMVLSRLGYVVSCVASGQEALMAMAHSRFSLALIALHLPDLPGLTLARRLRQTPGAAGSMPIIMFGDAWDPERIVESCREAGLDGYLPKPISIARLVSSIHDSIQRPPRESGVPSVMPQPRIFEIERLSAFTDGDPQLERELTSLYVATASHYLDQMRSALGGGGDWRKAAHSLKGASANIGAAAMARMAAESEHAAPSAAALGQLEVGLQAVRGFLARRSAPQAPVSPVRRTG